MQQPDSIPVVPRRPVHGVLIAVDLRRTRLSELARQTIGVIQGRLLVRSGQISLN